MKRKWYETNTAIILLLIFFFPVGLFLMWKFGRWNKVLKIVISVLIALAVIGNLGNTDNSEVNTNTIATEINKEGKNSKDLEQQKSEIKESVNEIKDNVSPVEEKKIEEPIGPTEEEYKALCESFDYKDIARNPANYENKDVSIYGKVIQVSEGFFDTVTLRVATKESEHLGYSDDIYIVTYKQVDSNRMLEDDMVTIWGLCNGVTTYTSVLGGNVTVPSVDMKYYEID